jgi:hypothetical protein
MSASHVAGIEPCLAQGRGGVASYMEAVNTKGDYWLSLRKLPDPFINALRISPNGSLHDVLCLAAVMLWAGIFSIPPVSAYLPRRAAAAAEVWENRIAGKASFLYLA